MVRGGAMNGCGSACGGLNSAAINIFNSRVGGRDLADLI